MAALLKCFRSMNCFGKGKIPRQKQGGSLGTQESSSPVSLSGIELENGAEAQESEDPNSHPKGLDIPEDPSVRPSLEGPSDMTGSGRTSPHTPDSSDSLHQDLYRARIEYPAGTHHFFISESSKDDILTKEAIMNELKVTYHDIDETDVNQRADVVFECARNLFGILAYMKKGGEAWNLIEEGVSDADLPFERCQGEADPFSLRRKSGEKVLQEWEPNERETFSREQWCMLAPVFKDKKHHDLHTNTVLPFVTIDSEREAQGSMSGGGHSEVITTRIHNAHHTFPDDWTAEGPHQKVAIKRLFTKNRKDFENEQSILIKLGNKTNPHTHLVKLLASYECNGEFYLIFPRANCNLRKYWEERPTPQFDKETVSWSLDQMRGIAQALNTIHNFKVTHPHTVKEDGKTPPIERGEEIFGRHGDIKPENIIWYERIPNDDNGGKGFLQITDFGLGRFHGRDSRTEKWPYNVVGTMTYEPPECMLQRPVRRAYDMWSLGCLYIEFATWLLKGNEEIEGFSNRRGRELSLDPRISEDQFFTIIKTKSNQPRDAIVREGVREWVNSLHKDKRCSRFIHDLLDLVMRDLLLTEATKRAEASWLCIRFNGFLEKARKDKDYLCAPDPHPQEHHPSEHAARSLSASAIQIPKKPQQQVSSTEPEGPSTAESQQHSPRDLVGRDAGTPGFAATRNASATWPIPRT